jgi:hypothetical protein
MVGALSLSTYYPATAESTPNPSICREDFRCKVDNKKNRALGYGSVNYHLVSSALSEVPGDLTGMVLVDWWTSKF